MPFSCLFLACFLEPARHVTCRRLSAAQPKKGLIQTFPINNMYTALARGHIQDNYPSCTSPERNFNILSVYSIIIMSFSSRYASKPFRRATRYRDNFHYASRRRISTFSIAAFAIDESYRINQSHSLAT